jgi:hypothetical protein
MLSMGLMTLIRLGGCLFSKKEGKRNIGSVVQIAAARNPQVELHREHFLSKRLHKAVTLASELVKKLIIVASFLTSPGGTTV